MMADHEIDSGTIVRKLVGESEMLDTRDASKWRHTFDDGLVAECIRMNPPDGSEWWEVRIIRPMQMHLRQRFKDHNAAYRFIMRDHIE